MSLTDWRGTPLDVGVHVVYPSRQYGNMWMTEGEIISVQGDKVAVRKIQSSMEEKTSSRAQSQTAYPSLARLTVI